MTAPAVARGSPIRISTGATMAPVPRTDAVHDPVIIPGNMMTTVSATSRSALDPPSSAMRPCVSSVSSPFASITFMNTMAVRMTSDTSR